MTELIIDSARFKLLELGLYMNPINTRRHLDVDSTLFERPGRQMDIETTLCAYSKALNEVDDIIHQHRVFLKVEVVVGKDITKGFVNKLLFFFSRYFNRDGMPVLIADDGAFNKILIFGLENCYDLMIKK